MNPDPGLGTLGSWVLGIVAVLLAAVVLPAALAAVTFATRGTPFRRVRALDDRGGDGAGWACGLHRRLRHRPPVAERREAP